MSCQVRCISQLNEEADAVTRLDLRKKEKNAVVNNAHRAACAGTVKSKERWMETKMFGVMGCFWREEVPSSRLSPLVRVKSKLLNDSVGKPS